MSIPKIIHYCNFGNKPFPSYIRKCMKSWSKLNGYTFMEWNEKNFNINYSGFTKECYDAKKYAYVSDVCRLYALYNYGGIYLDTDVMINKKFDELLNDKMFIGYLYDTYFGTAVIGSEKNNPVIKEILDKYESFTLKSAPTANNELFTEFFWEYPDIKLNNEEQVLKSGVHVYPKHFFEMPSLSRKNNFSTHFSFGSWRTSKNSFKSRLKRKLFNVPGFIYILLMNKRLTASKWEDKRRKHYEEYLSNTRKQALKL